MTAADWERFLVDLDGLSRDWDSLNRSLAADVEAEREQARARAAGLARQENDPERRLDLLDWASGRTTPEQFVATATAGAMIETTVREIARTEDTEAIDARLRPGR